MLTVYGIETVIDTRIFVGVFYVATVLTVYGIETGRPYSPTSILIVALQQCLPFTVLKLYFLLTSFSIARLQQCLPFTVCAEGCETAEEQRDDEGRTSQVPEQSEGKTKMMKQQYLPFTVLEHTHQVRS